MEVHTDNGNVGIEPLKLKQGLEIHYRMWIDRGRGKYGAIEITHSDLQRLHKMIGGMLGGAKAKPARAKKENQSR